MIKFYAVVSLSKSTHTLARICIGANTFGIICMGAIVPFASFVWELQYLWDQLYGSYITFWIICMGATVTLGSIVCEL